MSPITLSAIAIGLIIGFANESGIFTLISTLGSMWVGNALSGLIKGEIQTLAGRNANINKILYRDDEPGAFYFEVFFEAVIGGIALFYFFYGV